MANIGQDEVAGEKFARNGGSFISVVGGLAVVGFLVGWLVDMDGVPLWVPAAALVGAVVLWTSTIRPRVAVEHAELVLRNMFSDVRIPLVTIEEIAVQQVLAVRAGEKRFVCAGVGRSLRQVMMGSSMQKARAEVGGLTGELGGGVASMEPGINYGDYVETRVRELIKEDRARRGISSIFSPEAEELRGRIRREWAWPEIAALVATLVFLVIAIQVS